MSSSTGGIHAARLERSARLQRVDALLADGLEHSTLEIIRRAHVCAVNTAVAELRTNGRRIRCRQAGRVWYYRCQDEPRLAGF